MTRLISFFILSAFIHSSARTFEGLNDCLLDAMRFEFKEISSNYEYYKNIKIDSIGILNLNIPSGFAADSNMVLLSNFLDKSIAERFAEGIDKGIDILMADYKMEGNELAIYISSYSSTDTKGGWMGSIYSYTYILNPMTNQWERKKGEDIYSSIKENDDDNEVVDNPFFREELGDYPFGCMFPYKYKYYTIKDGSFIFKDDSPDVDGPHSNLFTIKLNDNLDAITKQYDISLRIDSHLNPHMLPYGVVINFDRFRLARPYEDLSFEMEQPKVDFWPIKNGYETWTHKYIADSLGVKEYPVVFPSMSLRKDTLELKVEVKQATLNDKYIPQYTDRKSVV